MSTQPTHPLHLRPILDPAPSPYRVDSGAVVTMPRTLATPEERAELLRRRLGLTSATLGFLLGGAAVGVATGWIPGM
jgi:hypothetical protein